MTTLDYNNRKNGYKNIPKVIKVRNYKKYFNIQNETNEINNKTNKYKLTDKGIYSISKPVEAEKISKILSKYFKNPEKIVITDATLGMGGNTMSFVKYFKCVNAFELDEVHYETAKHNIKLSDFEKKVKIIKGDYTKLFNSVTQNIIYIDAPWGGVNYYKVKNLKLKLGGENIATFCNKLKSKTKYIALNLPFNYDFNDLLKKTEFEKLKVYKITKKQYLGVLS
jgi:16S rRNA G966 N2-methylase RsmD